MVTLRDKHPLDKKKPLKKTIEQIWSWVIILLVPTFFISFALFEDDVSSFSSLIPIMILFLIVIILIIFICTYVYECFYLKYYFYDIVGTNLIIKKGVFSRNEITIPFNRLQDVYVDEDVLDRIFGLYDVHVSSATSISGSLSHIDGVNKQNSEALKELILQRIGKDDK